MQSLFEWDFTGYPDAHLTAITARNINEFAPGIEDNAFIQDLVAEVASHRAKLDLVIEKAAPDWPIEQIAVVDRNILRLGLYELLFGNREAVPPRVAINEAIELAKTFGGENSGKFINGVLGAVYRELGEPDKDTVPAKKKFPHDIPYEQMPVETLAGAVVYAQEGGQIKLALVHDIFGYWTLSKGHLEPGEQPAVGVSRIISDELSLVVKAIGEPLGSNEYVASNKDKGKLRKNVMYFLAEAKQPDELKLKESGGLTEARWFKLEELPELRVYDDVTPFITKAVKQLLGKK
jgi:N utilization substance protein B